MVSSFWALPQCVPVTPVFWSMGEGSQGWWGFGFLPFSFLSLPSFFSSPLPSFSSPSFLFPPFLPFLPVSPPIPKAPWSPAYSPNLTHYLRPSLSVSSWRCGGRALKWACHVTCVPKVRPDGCFPWHPAPLLVSLSPKGAPGLSGPTPGHNCCRKHVWEDIPPV